MPYKKNKNLFEPVPQSLLTFCQESAVSKIPNPRKLFNFTYNASIDETRATHGEEAAKRAFARVRNVQQCILPFRSVRLRS